MDYFKYKQDEFIQVDEDGRKVLAVDIQPEKACIFNCIVCSRGKTKYQTQWHDFGPIEDSLQGLREKIAEDKPDLVEIYGQGDILTNLHLGEIIDCIHDQGLPVRLITNCYLLGIDGHMELASKCEEVVGAFGIVDEEEFQKYHRPLPEFGFTAAKQTESIAAFSRQYNDSDESARVLKDAVARIRCDSLWVASTAKLGISDERVEEIRKIIQG